MPFFIPGAVPTISSSGKIPQPSHEVDWSKYYLDYMNRDIYWGQDAALFADAWLENLKSVINIGNIGKATGQGWLGWRLGIYSTLFGGIVTEIVVDVLILTTAITIIDPNDQHNWGVDDLVRGAVTSDHKLDWSKVTSFGSVV
jgi:hypothetical protein